MNDGGSGSSTGLPTHGYSDNNNNQDNLGVDKTLDATKLANLHNTFNSVISASQIWFLTSARPYIKGVEKD